jgi:3-dehydroquinate dehydratase-2
MKYKIIVINGPNLNLLGEREKEKYGSVSLKNIENDCIKHVNKSNIEVDFVQSNIEGELVSLIQNARENYSGVIIKPFSSIAIFFSFNLYFLSKSNNEKI